MKNKHSLKKALRICRFVLDTIAFTAIISAIILLTFHIRYKTAVILICICTACSVMLLKTIKERSGKKAEEEKAGREEAIERILLLDDSALGQAMGEEGFILIRKLEPDKCDVLNAIRNGAGAVGLLQKERDSIELIEKYAPQTRIIDVDGMISCLYENNAPASKRAVPALLFSVKDFNKYFVTGCILLTISFFAGYKIYYRVLSGICFVIAVVTGFFDRRNMRKILRIFLDKKGDR